MRRKKCLCPPSSEWMLKVSQGFLLTPRVVVWHLLLDVLGRVPLKRLYLRPLNQKYVNEGQKKKLHICNDV